MIQPRAQRSESGDHSCLPACLGLQLTGHVLWEKSVRPPMSIFLCETGTARVTSVSYFLAVQRTNKQCLAHDKPSQKLCYHLAQEPSRPLICTKSLYFHGEASSTAVPP